MSYQNAIKILTSRIKRIKYVPAAERDQQPRRLDTSRIRHWVKALGYERPAFDVIHVTGTKGKGSTCAWVEALLQAHFRSKSIPAKIGLYTTPHLTTESERIRIDSNPISNADFANQFFRVWETIFADVNRIEDDMPGYLELLALLSAAAFHEAKVDVAIYEVHAGGRHDATNMWNKTVACGFNTIGLDHVPLLGDNVQEIAWNKAGIMKPGCQAFSVPQEPLVQQALETEADKLRCPLTFINGNQFYIPGTHTRKELEQEPLRNNLVLAIELANAYLISRMSSRLSENDIAEAISRWKLTGRLQVIRKPRSPRWHLDIAHNTLSMPVALDWFMSEVQNSSAIQDLGSGESLQSRRLKTLIFGHQSDHRDVANVISSIISHCKARSYVFDRLILASHRHRVTGDTMFSEEHASQISKLWKEMPGSPAVLATNLEKALQSPESVDIPLDSDVLILGSTHLVSSALAYLET